MRAILQKLGKPGNFLGMFLDYDYASPNLEPLPKNLGSCFPNVKRGPSWNTKVPHNQRRNWSLRPRIGLVTWDESTLLYNYGLADQGKELLEIGCWVGWSTVVFLMAGERATVVDPVFIDHPAGPECRESVARSGFAERAELIGGFSPAAVDALTDAGKRFSLLFIDGNHDGDAPLIDAKACHRAATDDAVILLHDAIWANIGDALTWLGEQGWNTGVHYTSRFLGVAWRGAARPLSHVPDPAIDWEAHIRTDCPHLQKFTRL